MSLGNLAVKVDAGIGGFTSNMDVVARSAKTAMTSAAGSVDDYRTSLLQASDEMHKAALGMASSMQAANDAIAAGADRSSVAIQKIASSADSADFTPMGDKIAEAVGTGISAGIAQAEKGWDSFVEQSKSKALVVGFAVSAIFAAVGLGAIYTAYKVISSSLGFITGLLTGESYKSDNINALIEANNQVKEIQSSLVLTAQQAAATNAALAAMGVDKPAYISTFNAAADAVRGNTDEFERLGVAYKDAGGKLLPLEEVVRNADQVLQSYTEGWDRNKAATALGLGSAAAVAAAASVSSQKISEARDRLNDYNLGIGPESQAAVKAYEDAMRDFNRETELTSQGFKRAIADNVMPLLTDLAVFFKDGFPSAVNAFRYSMAVVTSIFYGLKLAVYTVAESVLGSIDAMSIGIVALATAAARALTGDFSGAKDALITGWDGAKDRMALIGANIAAQARHDASAVKQAWAMDDRAADGVKPPDGKKWVPPPKAEKTEATTKDPFATDMMSLSRTQAGIDYVIANFDKYQGKVKESKAAMAEFDTTLGKYSDTQRKSEQFDPLTAAQKASYIAKNKLIDEGMEKERQMQVLRKFDNAGQQFDFKESQALEYRKQDIAWMGKGQLELSKLTEARRIDGEVAAMINQTQIELGKQGLKISAEKIASITASADAAKAAQMELLTQQDAKSRDPWFNASESIRKYGEEAANSGVQIGNSIANGMKTAEDAFVSMAMTGKLSFGDLAKSVIADIIRMQAKAAVSGLFNFALSAVGSYFGGAASSGGSGAGTIDAGARGSFSTGGYVAGEGTATSDSIRAWLSNGEFVMNADTTGKNRPLLEYLNNGGDAANAPKFATGGYVGTASAMATDSGGTAGVQVNVYIQSDGQSTVEAPAGLEQFGKELGSFVDGRFNLLMGRARKQGGPLWNMSNGVA